MCLQPRKRGSGCEALSRFVGPQFAEKSQWDSLEKSASSTGAMERSRPFSERGDVGFKRTFHPSTMRLFFIYLWKRDVVRCIGFVFGWFVGVLDNTMGYSSFRHGLDQCGSSLATTRRTTSTTRSSETVSEQQSSSRSSSTALLVQRNEAVDVVLHYVLHEENILRQKK